MSIHQNKTSTECDSKETMMISIISPWLSIIPSDPFKIIVSFQDVNDAINLACVSKIFCGWKNKKNNCTTLYTILRNITHKCIGCGHLTVFPTMTYFRGGIKKVMCEKCALSYCQICVVCRRTRPGWFLQEGHLKTTINGIDKRIYGGVSCGDDSSCFVDGNNTIIHFDTKKLSDEGVHPDDFWKFYIERSATLQNFPIDGIDDTSETPRCYGWSGDKPYSENMEFIASPSTEATALIDRIRMDTRYYDGMYEQFHESTKMHQLFLYNH